MGVGMKITRMMVSTFLRSGITIRALHVSSHLILISMQITFSSLFSSTGRRKRENSGNLPKVPQLVNGRIRDLNPGLIL